MLGAAQIATRGWSATEAETAFLRARELAERLDRSDELGWALFRLGTLYEVRGDYERSDPLLEQALALSGPTASNGLLTDSHELLACSLFHQGVFDHALEHAEQGLAAYDGQYFNPVTAAYGDNAGAACHSWAALSLWFLGYPDLARERAREAVALADDPPPPARLRDRARAGRDRRAMPPRLRGDPRERTGGDGGGDPGRLRVPPRHGDDPARVGTGRRGVARAGDRRARARASSSPARPAPAWTIPTTSRCSPTRTPAPDTSTRPGLPSRPASGTHQPAAGSSSRASSTDWPGSSSCASTDATRPRTRMREALELARGQGSPSLELRAALSLAGHLRSEGKTNAARGLITGVYSTFTEGFETHDLVAARELLEQLGS